jgi:hypothetical protein
MYRERELVEPLPLELDPMKKRDIAAIKKRSHKSRVDQIGVE